METAMGSLSCVVFEMATTASLNPVVSGMKAVLLQVDGRTRTPQRRDGISGLSLQGGRPA